MQLTIEVDVQLEILKVQRTEGAFFYVVKNGEDVGYYALLDDAKRCAVAQLWPVHKDQVTENQARALVDELAKEWEDVYPVADIEFSLHRTTIAELLPIALKHMDTVGEQRPSEPYDSLDIVTAYIKDLAIWQTNK